MPSELERIAGRLRFLSDQAQQHRRPVVEASQKLREAANAVASCRFDQPDGAPITPPPHLAARLEQAATRARDAVAPLTQTAELLRTFAARLAASGAATGSPAPGGSVPGASTAGASPTGSTPGAHAADDTDDQGGNPSPRPTDRPRRSGSTTSPTPSGTGSVGRSRYGRYPTTTAVRLSPGNRSYEVGSQPQ